MLVTPPIGEVDRSRPDVARDVLQTSIGTSVCIMDVEYRSLISKLAHQSSLIFHRATATATRTSSVIGSVPVLVKSVWCVCQGADTTGQRRCHPCLLRSSSVACSIELYGVATGWHEPRAQPVPFSDGGFASQRVSKRVSTGTEGAPSLQI